MNTGSALARFTITLSQAVTEPVQVDWFTSDGTAKAGVDYAANKGTVIFAPSETSKTVDILVYGRAVGSEDRSFFVEMLPPANAILGASIGECIITVDTSGSTPVTQIIVPTGPKGIQGKSAYQSYLDTTTDNPPMTEAEWVDSLKGDPQEIAQEVAPLIDVGNTVLTAEGTESLGHPDQTTVKAVARRVAYAGAAKIANVTLADGDNAVAPSSMTGDTIDLSSEGLCPRILRGSTFITPVWSVQPDGKILIKSAVAGDVLYLCQYDFASGSKNLNSNTREQWRRTLLMSGITLVDGSFETGASVNSKTQAVWHQAGGQCYVWTGVLPKTVNAATTPGSDPLWKAVPRVIGVARSFAELRTITPTDGGQRITLDSYYEGGRTGGGVFIARSTIGLSVVPTDDGGVIALVNSTWFWERVDQDNVTVEGFGAISYIVPADGSVPSDAVVASDAFQRMFDSVHRIVVAEGNNIGYLIDAPVKLMSQSFWKVNLKGCTLTKLTSTKTGFAEYIAIAGGSAYVEGNINCVFFIGGTQCRYWEIQGGYIDCHLAPSGDRPTGIYISEAVGYKIEKTLTRGCKYGLRVKSAWLGELNLCRFSESITHGVYYDSTRFTSAGVAAARGQASTSLHISSCYAAASQLDGWRMESCQYINFQSSACDGAGSVSGGSSYYFNACDVVGDMGAESPSSSATAYIQLVGGTATLRLNTYDTITTPNPIIHASGSAIFTLSLAGRTQRTRLATIVGAGTYGRIDLLSYYDGVTTVPAPSLVDPGSFLEVLAARDTNGTLNYVNGKVQRSNNYTAAYDARPASLTPYIHKEARFGVPAGTTTVNIPLADITALFPNFNRGSNTFVEWLQVSTRNGAGITYGAIFACTAGAIVGSKTDAQVSTGNGSAQAVVSSFSVSGSNLVITYAGSLPTDSIIILRPV